MSDANVEPQPLWEYPCRAKGRPTKLMDFNFREKVPEDKVEVSKVIEIEDFYGNVNGKK